MAAIYFHFSLERDNLNDQIAQLDELRDRLFSRHGDRFRDLARAIEALVDGAITPEIHYLGDGLFTASVSTIAELLCEGRRLGVI